MKTLHSYTIVIEPDDNGTFVTYVPTIEGCHALGYTTEEAQSELVHVFDMIQEEHLKEGLLLPEDVHLTFAYAS